MATDESPRFFDEPAAQAGLRSLLLLFFAPGLDPSHHLPYKQASD
jgi:hypothetical protein